jgi:hypothetical protein
MNRYILVLAIALLSTLAASAQEIYQLKIRGKLISPDGVTRIKETDLVATNGHLLVYETDISGRSFNLGELFANGGFFRENIHSDDAAVANNNKISFDLHDSDGFSGNVGGVPTFTGRMIATGRVTEKSVRFSVVGVWDGGTDTLFKGVITGKRILP